MNRIVLAKSKTNYIMLLLIIMAAVAFTACSDDEKKVNSGISAKCIVGYNSVVSIRDGNPVKFQIQNSGSDFSGDLDIYVPIDSLQDEVISIPIEIPSGSEKTIETFIKVHTVIKDFDYKIVSDGVVQFEGDFKPNKVISPMTYCIGVISDRPDKYKFFSELEKTFDMPVPRNVDTDDDMAYDMAIKEEEAIEVQSHSFSQSFYINDMKNLSSEEALKFFDYLFIGESSNIKLDELGETSLMNWVENGGVIIIEAGENYKKVMKNLPESLVQLDNMSLQDASFDERGIRREDIKYVGDIKVLTGSSKREGVKELKINDTVAGYCERIGKGTIITVNTLLTSDVVSDWNSKGDYINDIIYSSYTMPSNDRQSDMFNQFRYDGMEWKTRSLPSETEPPLNTIAIILLLYIVVVGPILYIVFKKLDKREFVWILAPVVAVVIIVVISYVGGAALGGEPIVNEISYILYQQDADELNVRTYLRAFNDESGDLVIDYPSDVDLKPISDRDYYGGYDDEVSTDREVLYKIRYGEHDEYTYYDKRLWDSTCFIGSTKIDISGSSANAKFMTKDNKNNIVFTNNTMLELKYPMLCYSNTIYKIPKIEAGKTYTYNIDDLEIMTEHDFWDYDRSISDDEMFFKETVGDSLMNNYRRDAYDVVKIFGYTSDIAGYDININGSKGRELARNIVELNLTLDFVSGEKITLDNRGIEYDSLAVHDYGKGITTQDGTLTEESQKIYFERYYSNYDNKKEEQELYAPLYDSDFNIVETTFILPNSVDIMNLQVDFNNNTESSFTDYIDTSTLEEKYYIYNYQESKYDEVFFEGKKIEDEKLYTVNMDQYVDCYKDSYGEDAKKVRIRVVKDFSQRNDMDNEYEIKPHQIYIEGVVK